MGVREPREAYLALDPNIPFGEVDPELFGHLLLPRPKTRKSKPDLQIWIALRSIWQGLLDTVLNLQLDISIDGQMLKALRDRAVTIPNYQAA